MAKLLTEFLPDVFFVVKTPGTLEVISPNLRERGLTLLRSHLATEQRLYYLVFLHWGHVLHLLLPHINGLFSIFRNQPTGGILLPHGLVFLSVRPTTSSSFTYFTPSNTSMPSQ